MTKRKAASALLADHSTKRRKIKPLKRKAAKARKAFRFLELPAELRTDILQLAAKDKGTGLLSRRSRGQLSSNDALSLVNKQLRREYVAVCYGFAPTILIEVLDFDFRHIVTFLNKLHAGEVATLPATSEQSKDTDDKSASSGTDDDNEELDRQSSPGKQAKQRTFKVILDMTRKCPSNPPYLQRWLARTEATGKTGWDTAIEYEAASRRAIKKWRQRRSWYYNLTAWSWSERQREELEKMSETMRRVGATVSKMDYDDESEYEDDYRSSWLDSDYDSDDDGWGFMRELVGDY